MTLNEILCLGLAAAAAGLVNAVAGGGTMITFPLLLFFGTAPVTANASSTVALVIGTFGSIFGFRQHMAMIRPWISRFVPVSVLGGLIGSALLTRTADKAFAQMVPFLILFATLLFLAQGLFRKLAGSRPMTPLGIWIAIGFQFAVAVYGGYFGAGIGILMLASLGFMGMADIHEMNALKNLLSSLINLVASAWFIASGIVDWSKTSVMTVGAVTGYYAGAHLSQLIPQQSVRHVITGIGIVLSVVMFYRQFVG